jgi:hypothetical protein
MSLNSMSLADQELMVFVFVRKVNELMDRLSVIAGKLDY